MRVLIAPDKFKGSLSAREAAAAIRDGWRSAKPDTQCDLAPVADGGEGTAEIFCEALGGGWVEAEVQDARGSPVRARYAWIPARRLAVIEMSEASGLWRLEPARRDPLRASTFGTGELMKHAVEHGAGELLIGLGGSATNDAGVGMAAALGWRFLDEQRQPLAPHPENFPRIRHIVPQEFPARVRALCDVTNPLLGERGATRFYGPQKGAHPQMVEDLERALTHLADTLQRHLSRDFRDHPGAGAAGGLGFGLMTFAGARLQKGFEAIGELLGLEERMARADIVITGEGKLDEQSLHGKAVGEIARLARKHGKPVVALVGCKEGDFPEFAASIPIANASVTLEDAQARAAELLRAAAAEAAQMSFPL